MQQSPLIGGATGAALLIFMPAESFTMVVPFLLIVAAVLAAAQPAVARFVRERAGRLHGQTMPVTAGLMVGVFATGIYGGYFGAAQGVILLAILGILWSTNLNQANGAKNVLAGIANVISSVLFLFSGLIDWWVVLSVGLGAALGGWIGAKIGRKLPPVVLRAVLVVIALTAAVVFLINN